jgi:hypothetical protein
LKQLDLFTRKVAKYRFAVLFYVPGCGDMRIDVEISKNDKRAAIATAKKGLGLKFYEQATAILLSPLSEGSP